ncbi:hypothetical protein FGO68_gene8684 [Halteria grandinella]|uniref:Uncharacterized protein n=1 Tax=Halteria grandinella TaxID=5974 RepID=A0A8J8SZW0_HALGN|nr:hypothetical protein FGO68_gene8684 [Halteria grandinella]
MKNYPQLVFHAIAKINSIQLVRNFRMALKRQLLSIYQSMVAYAMSKSSLLHEIDLIIQNNYSELFIYFVKLIQQYELNPKIPSEETIPAMIGNRDFSDCIWDVILDSLHPTNVLTVLALNTSTQSTDGGQVEMKRKPYEVWYLQYLYEMIIRQRE